MAVEFTECEQPVTEAKLDAVEQRLGIHLPEDYRRFLGQYNGGRPSRNVFTFTEGRSGPTESTVAWFLAVYDGEYENFEWSFRTYKVIAKRMPANLVPIARDPFGNQICMSFEGEDKGAIYFWDHEKESRKPSYKNCYLIAKTLDAFLNGLHG